MTVQYKVLGVSKLSNNYMLSMRIIAANILILCQRVKRMIVCITIQPLMRNIVYKKEMLGAVHLLLHQDW